MPSAPETAPAELEKKPKSWAALWRTVTRFEAQKVAPWVAFRNAIGVTLPLLVGQLAGSAATGLVASTGALNVSFSDGSDPYPKRARRMLAASAIVAIAVFCGTACAHDPFVAVGLTTVWAFVAGMLVSVGTTQADIGLISLVTLLVFSAQSMSVQQAAVSGVLAFGGGLLQTFLALALWPVRRYEPVRQALGNLYQELSRTAAAPVRVSEAPPASAETSEAQNSLATLARDHSVEGERYIALFNQAERIRLSIMALLRLRKRMDRDENGARDAKVLHSCSATISQVLAAIADSLLSEAPAKLDPEGTQQLHQCSGSLRRSNDVSALDAMAADARAHIDAIAGQLRSAMELAGNASPAGARELAHREASKPWTLRLGGTLATLRANLSLQSAACRHAIRLAGCVAIGIVVGRELDWQRSYWLPMTVAIILKPDFTATFSRGLLRLAGTFAGLVIATALFQLLAPATGAEILLVAVFTFVLRCFGPANYGILVAAVSAFVVVLFAIIGVSPADVVAARGLNTLAGGAIALGAYWLWPTWEKHQVAETLAKMLDAYRQYFRAVRDENKLESHRIEARLARSNLEASVDRLGAEPGVPSERIRLLVSILANSHRLVHAFMALESGLLRSGPVPPRSAFEVFANDVELTLYYLASALRGSKLQKSELPDLREDYYELVESGASMTDRYALVNTETDRITNSLNTMAEEILQLIGCTLQLP